jgi:hypothetical protein
MSILSLGDLAAAAEVDVGELLELSADELMQVMVQDYQLGVLPRKRISQEYEEQRRLPVLAAPLVTGSPADGCDQDLQAEVVALRAELAHKDQQISRLNK